MRRKLLFILIISFLLILLTACYNSPEFDLVVCKTPTGAKYHKLNCRYVKGKAIEINLSKAIYDGLEPCRVCHPPTKDSLDKLN